LDLGYKVSLNKSVYGLQYLSNGRNLAIDGLTTVPSTAPES
jgi:hypothetical protein